jgi:hypothetical protein
VRVLEVLQAIVMGVVELVPGHIYYLTNGALGLARRA